MALLHNMKTTTKKLTAQEMLDQGIKTVYYISPVLASLVTALLLLLCVYTVTQISSQTEYVCHECEFQE